MSLPEWLDYIKKEGSVIKEAPISYGITVIISIVIVIIVTNGIYALNLKIKNDLIDSQEKKIESLEGENEKLKLQSQGEETTIYTPKESASKWSSIQKTPIIGKTFKNERVELDGFSYIECKFINVTFVYKGEAPYDMVNIEFIGTPRFDISSSEPLGGLIKLLEGTNHLKNLKLNQIDK